jgi:hypothetical protein
MMMKKSGKLSRHVANSNNAIDSSPTLQRSVGIIAFKKIYEGELILIVISNIGEDNTVVSIKCTVHCCKSSERFGLKCEFSLVSNKYILYIGLV